MGTPLYMHTRKSFEDELFSRFGKGRQYAAAIYSAWMQQGTLKHLAIEPQGRALFERMVEATDFSLPKLEKVVEEEEGAKCGVRLGDGSLVESVVIPALTRTTVCISSQMGCKRACAFCETGRMGFKRSLRAEEMVAQVFHAVHTLKRRVRNLVFMGMGEPFDNFDALMQAIAVLSDSSGLGFGLRHITISTSGHAEGIVRFAEEAPSALNLAVSITTANESLRKKLMPITRTWGLEAIKEAMRRVLIDERRSILVSVVLLKGVNDALEDAEALARYLEGMRVKINCIPYNPQTVDRFVRPDEATVSRFIAHLRARGFKVLLRNNRGEKMFAGCGQLGTCSQTASRLG